MKTVKATETAPAQLVAETPVGQPDIVAVQPTQMRRPWRTVVRSVFQGVVALLTLAPLIVTNVYDSPDAYPVVVAQLLVVSGIVTRVMALPQVEVFLRKYVPFLAAAPKG